MKQKTDKLINGVRVYFESGQWCCCFDDYKKARIIQGMRWSEKSFCDWCDKHSLTAVG